MQLETFIADYLANSGRQDKHCYCQQLASRIWPLDKHIKISPWTILKINFKSVYIFTVNITKAVDV